jgi:AP-4 complex subunit mu-1
VELTIKLKASFPKNMAASWVHVKFNVPKKASGVTPEPLNNQDNQKCEYMESSNSVEWMIKKMQGESEVTLLTKITLPQASTINAQRETGPISLHFEIPMYNVSNFQIKSLKVLSGEENPARWIRYLTKSSSYVCRI